MKRTAICIFLSTISIPLPVYASKPTLPAPQQRLLDTLSTYSNIYNKIPENALLPIHQSAIVKKYRMAFCLAIPPEAQGWIGEVDTVRLSQDGKGIGISVELDPYDTLHGVPLILGGGLLMVSNYLSGAGVSMEALRDYSRATIYQDSPLYKVASTISNGDLISFSGSLTSYKSQIACEQTLGITNLFGYMHFSKIIDLGPNPTN